MVCDQDGRPIALALTDGSVADITFAKQIVRFLPKAKSALADRAFDSDPLRAALIKKKIEPCIPGRKHRLEPVIYDKKLYGQRHKIENAFARIKDWRRIATRYDRCAHTFFSAICLAVTVIFFL